jgi:hypothetical protein
MTRRDMGVSGLAPGSERLMEARLYLLKQRQVMRH